MATKTKVQAKWQKLRDGMATAFPAGSNLSLDGAKLTQAQVLAKIDGVLSLYTGKETAQGNARTAVAALRTAAPRDKLLFDSFVAAVKGELGPTSPLLGQFGLAPRAARKVPTAQQKALAAAKRVATRKARGILGSKQRAAIPAVTGLTLAISGSAVAPAVAGAAASTVASTTTAAAKPLEASPAPTVGAGAVVPGASAAPAGPPTPAK